MRTEIQKEHHSHSLLDAARAKIAEYLNDECRNGESCLGNLDRWSQQRIVDESLAKAALVFAADDPAEACYRDLIREIDTEAASGIYLIRKDARPEHLRQLLDETGVSGELHQNLETIETAGLNHDRAHVDATVSALIMSFLMDDAQSVQDMMRAMRALAYAFHEDDVRRRFGLERLLEQSDRRIVKILVTTLTERSGNFNKRAGEIRRKADTLHRTS